MATNRKKMFKPKKGIKKFNKQINFIDKTQQTKTNEKNNEKNNEIFCYFVKFQFLLCF